MRRAASLSPRGLLLALLLLALLLASSFAPGPSPSSGALLPVGLRTEATSDPSNGSSSDPNPSALPPVTCPLSPVNSTFGSFNCFQTLDLTELFVILITLTITFYVYKDADKAELPGEASEVPVTAQEELEQRVRREEEERLREQLDEEEEGHR